MSLTYRDCTSEDETFLYGLHRATMRVYVEETWGGWDEAWQRDYFHQRFSPGAIRILQLDGVDIGLVSVQERTEELFLSSLEILPAFQRQGIGSQVVRALIEQASAQGKTVALKVLKSNRLARHLYQRLGFGVTGETDTHYVMATLGAEA